MAFFKRKKQDDQVVYIKAKDLIEHYQVSSKQLYEILRLLKWATKSERRGWLVTELGLSNGAKQEHLRGTDFIVWDVKIKNNFEFINAIHGLKETQKIKQVVGPKKKKVVQPKRMTKQEKKEKGDKYEEHVASFFREQGYYVWEHGKEKGVKDSGMDLYVKTDKEVYFVQCKDWNTWKLDHDKIQAIQTKIRNLLQKEDGLRIMSSNYKQKILYVTSRECLTPGAYTYIKENSDILEYQVVEMIS